MVVAVADSLEVSAWSPEPPLPPARAATPNAYRSLLAILSEHPGEWGRVLLDANRYRCGQVVAGVKAQAKRPQLLVRYRMQPGKTVNRFELWLSVVKRETKETTP